MRCVVVTGAKLKAAARCPHCRNKTADSRVREIGSPRIYCDYRCYGIAAESSILPPARRAPALNAGRHRS